MSKGKKKEREDGGITLRVHDIGLDREQVQKDASAVEIALGPRTRRERLMKAHLVGPADQAPATMEGVADIEEALTAAGAIEPPFDPISLIQLTEASSYLRPNIDSYAVNIDGFGHRFEPTIDLESSEAEQIVRDAIWLERVTAEEAKDPTASTAEAASRVKDVTDQEVKDRLEALKKQKRLEKFKLESLFGFVHPTKSFSQIRKETRQELEILGNGFWEILRNRRKEPAQIEPMPAATMRLLKRDDKAVEVEQNFRISPISLAKRKIWRRFRRYVQIQGPIIVFFKEFGDPRVVSRATGKIFKDLAALHLPPEEDGEGPDALEATEVIHFKIFSPRSIYGIPRWVGVLIAVLGSRHADEVNFLYFENKSVPPLALLVSGGKIGKASVPRIRDFIQNEIRGKRNFHKILIIEAESSQRAMPGQTPPQQPRIELKPLTDAQQSDALFQNYDLRNGEKIGASFRVPPILRGETKDFNRATADAAKKFTEQQVYEPERNDFDFLMNLQFIVPLEIALLVYKSLSPILRDPEGMAEVADKFSKAWGLTPQMVREIAGDALNKDLPEITAPWGRQPKELTLAGFAPGAVPGITAPLEPGQTAPPPTQGSMNAADRNGDGEGEVEDEAVSKAAGDLTTGDLATLGGLLQPAQGGAFDLTEEERKKLLARLFAQLRRMGLMKGIGRLSTLAKAVKEEQTAAAQRDGTAPEDVITLKVPSEEWKRWFSDDEESSGSEKKDAPAEPATT